MSFIEDMEQKLATHPSLKIIRRIPREVSEKAVRGVHFVVTPANPFDILTSPKQLHSALCKLLPQMTPAEERKSSGRERITIGYLLFMSSAGEEVLVTLMPTKYLGPARSFEYGGICTVRRKVLRAIEQRWIDYGNSYG